MVYTNGKIGLISKPLLLYYLRYKDQIRQLNKYGTRLIITNKLKLSIFVLSVLYKQISRHVIIKHVINTDVPQFVYCYVINIIIMLLLFVYEMKLQLFVFLF